VRTCNHIINETKSARDYGSSFPSNAVAIGSDNYGNILLLKTIAEGILGEQIYFWDHETGKEKVIAESILEL